MNPAVENLLSEYSIKKSQIKKRIKDFKKLYKGGNKEIFAELCFCILTPQSKAINCDKAVNRLKGCGLLLYGSERDIKAQLKGLARFHNKKSAYLLNARKFFTGSRIPDIKSRLNKKNIFKTREWLASNVKGLGYKEASHFLRNIGLGSDIAIVDRHVLKNLKSCAVIKKIPLSITKKDYIKIENKMREFSRKINIPLGELDLLFWSRQTGFIFK